jgi:DNA adenine methylase
VIKSPLRYPGGKSKAIDKIIQYIPSGISEYREPFVGGGSLSIYLKQVNPDLNVWINDINSELFLFWKYTRDELPNLVNLIRKIKGDCRDGRELFNRLLSLDVDKTSEIDRAVRFFILNRITFSGTVESGGYSEQAYHKRFTDSSIDRLVKLGKILTQFRITNLDYSELLHEYNIQNSLSKNRQIFFFFDPPYLTATKSKLYGKKGILHTEFDHVRLAQNLKNLSHPWLLTYDDSPGIRDLFSFANIYEWELQYSMNNYKQAHAAKGKELFICNYSIPLDLGNKVTISKNTVAEQLHLNI